MLMMVKVREDGEGYTEAESLLQWSESTFLCSVDLLSHALSRGGVVCELKGRTEE